MEFSRQDVEFASDGTICRAWHYLPLEPEDGFSACIVMAHGLGGTRDASLEPYAKKFAAAGYHVLLFDYRYFGASEGEPRQLFLIDHQLRDWESAIGYARGMEGVDPERIALWGTSFSGGHVIVAAAEDGKVAAVSAQAPMMDAVPAALNLIRQSGLLNFLRIGAYSIADMLRGWIGLSPARIPIVAPPGEFAMMSSHDAASGYATIAPPEWRNDLCARQALAIAGYRPISYAARVSCPVLIQVCTGDSVAPPTVAEATARRIGRKAELTHFSCGHFEIYRGEHFDRASEEQLAFYDRVLRNGP